MSILNIFEKIFGKLFGPKWKYAEYSKRMLAVESISNQAIITKIAKGDTNKNIRIAAIKKLSDQNALFEIAKKDMEVEVCLASTEKISDPNLLARLAIQTVNIAVGLEAIRNLTDQNILLDIVKRAGHSDIRFKAIEKLTDQNLLVDMIRSSHDLTIQLKGIKMLKDPDILASIALNNTNLDYSKTALEKITDQKSLAEIAKYAKNIDIRMIATKRLSDQNTLIEIAKNSKEDNIRKVALQKITDQNVMANIAKNDKSYSIRKLVYQNSEFKETQKALADIAKNDPKRDVRLSALGKISDQDVLFEIANEVISSDWSLDAIEKLTDQNKLAYFATNERYQYIIKVREKSISRLTDQKVLQEIVMSDKDKSIKRYAFNNLTDQGILSELAKMDKGIFEKSDIIKIKEPDILYDIVLYGKNLDIRQGALQAIHDNKLLYSIAKNCNDYNIRTEAIDNFLKTELIFKAENEEIFKFYFETVISQEILLETSTLAKLKRLYEIICNKVDVTKVDIIESALEKISSKISSNGPNNSFIRKEIENINRTYDSKNYIIETRLASLPAESKNELNHFFRLKMTENLTNLRTTYIKYIHSLFAKSDDNTKLFISYISEFIDNLNRNLIYYANYYTKENDRLICIDDESKIMGFPKYILQSYDFKSKYVGTQQYTHAIAQGVQHSLSFKIIDITTKKINKNKFEGPMPIFPKSFVGIPGHMEFIYGPTPDIKSKDVLSWIIKQMI